jgi:hypothetical protein
MSPAEKVELERTQERTQRYCFEGLFHTAAKVRPGQLERGLQKTIQGSLQNVWGFQFLPQEDDDKLALRAYELPNKAIRVDGPWTDSEVYTGADLITPNQFTPFQRRIRELYYKKPDNRWIIWMYCPAGGSGKSAIGKFMRYHHGVPLISASKSWDILKLVGLQPNKRMYLINLPNCREAGTSRQDLYRALECIKDGCFDITKGSDVRNVLMNPPHLVVFSNEPPNPAFLTQKRVLAYTLDPLDGSLLDFQDVPPFDDVAGCTRMDPAMIRAEWERVNKKRQEALAQGGELPQAGPPGRPGGQR